MNERSECDDMSHKDHYVMHVSSPEHDYPPRAALVQIHLPSAALVQMIHSPMKIMHGREHQQHRCIRTSMHVPHACALFRVERGGNAAQ